MAWVPSHRANQYGTTLKRAKQTGRGPEAISLRDFAREFEKNSIVTITLADTGKTYYVPRALLHNASEYFQKALDGGFKEASNQTLALPACDQECFEAFLYWLCHGNVPDSYNIELGNLDGSDRAQAYQVLCVKLWSFADAHLIRELKNEAVAKLLEHLGGARVTAAALRLVFETTPSGSKMRKLVLQEAVYGIATISEPGEKIQTLFEELDGLSECMAEFVVVAMDQVRARWERPSIRAREEFMDREP